MSELVGEECGVFGIYGNEGTDAARMLYFGMHALQHRGQESCGMAVNDLNRVISYRDVGLVSEVFGSERLEKISGRVGIGHTRYCSNGSNTRENAQPLSVMYRKGTLAIAHNGSIVNMDELRNKLEHDGAIFRSANDVEIIAYLIAQERAKTHSVTDALMRVAPLLRGSFSMLVMSPKKLIAIRDPNGIRPLCIGETEDGGVVFASESCALDAVGARLVRDVLPGEIVVAEGRADEGYKIHGAAGLESRTDFCPGDFKKSAGLCVFEHVYIAQPDSVIDSQSVYKSRLRAGIALAERHPVKADIVVGVPDSGIISAIGYSEKSGIQYGIGFVKNRYIGRTFIQPTQEMRNRSVSLKLGALRQTVEGKRVVLVEDSIVRGTNIYQVVPMLRRAGASEVHVRVASPRFIYPCHLGTDIPSREQLASVKYSTDELCEFIGADSLGFLELEDLPKTLNKSAVGVCMGCFTGKYPTEK